MFHKGLIVFLIFSSSSLLFIESGANPLDETKKNNTTTSDYLLENVPIYVVSVIGLFVVQTIILLLFGQPVLSPDGLKLWYGDTSGPGNSQHISDWYTFTHILHGFIMFFLTSLLPSVVTVNYCYLIALVSAVIWEVVENTPCVINRYRQTAVASGYNGDSVVNSFCDSLAMSLGFWVSYLISPWIVLGLAVLEEIVLGIVIRDNFIINVIQIVFSFKCISDWQGRKNGEQEQPTQVVSIHEGDLGDD